MVFRAGPRESAGRGRLSQTCRKPGLTSVLGAQDRPTLDQAGGTQAQAPHVARSGHWRNECGHRRCSAFRRGSECDPSMPSGDLGNRHHCRNSGHGAGWTHLCLPVWGPAQLCEHFVLEGGGASQARGGQEVRQGSPRKEPLAGVRRHLRTQESNFESESPLSIQGLSPGTPANPVSPLPSDPLLQDPHDPFLREAGVAGILAR